MGEYLEHYEYNDNPKEDSIEYMQIELQQQRGMLWLLGEIMKEAMTITSFKKLMFVLTDMLMGVMGVTTCYLWLKNENKKVEDYKVYFRSIELKNEFKVINNLEVPQPIANIDDTIHFAKSDINSSLLECVNIPCSRLAVPLRNFTNESIFGVLVLEHEEENFFTSNTIAFFETLTVFIAINAQNSKLMQSMSDDSITDPLTNTYNRRYLEHLLKEMDIDDNDMTVAVMDTDNFKSINDRLGHLQGDVVLQAIAQLAKGSTEEYGGKVVRYGGDEFVILIPKPINQAIHILEEFRKNIHYIPINYGLSMPVTVTLGACAYPTMTRTPQEAIKAADNALIRGKSICKNRVVVAIEEDIKAVESNIL